MRLTSIKHKIVISAGLCLLVAVVIVIAQSVLLVRRAALAAAQREAVAQAKIAATTVKAQVEAGMNTAHTLREALSPLKDPQSPLKLERAGVNAMLRQVLQDNPQFVGVYTLWEPNAFDGQDAKYANTPGHDASGRFIPYWSRGLDGKLQLEPLVDYEVEGAGDWYLLPKRTAREAIVGPLVYPVQGKDTVMASQVVPVVVDGKFYGITGVDIRLDFLQALADKINLYDNSATVILMNNSGKVAAANGHPELANKPLSEAAPALEQYLSSIQRGNTTVNLDSKTLEVIVPLQIGNKTAPWAVAIIIPASKITEEAYALLREQLLFGGAILLLALFLLWALARRIAAPLSDAAQAARRLAKGDVTVALTPSPGHDEASQLIQAMNEMTLYLREMAQMAHDISRGDLSGRITPRAPEDAFGLAFQQMNQYLEEMAAISDQIAMGHLRVKVVPKSARDRFGVAFHNMLDRTLRLVQSQDERDHIQNSIMKLLDDVAEVASGDLTVQAEVSADMTGAIADAFNMMIGELRQIIYQVKDTALQVNRSTEQIKTTTDELAAGSEFQSTQINRTSQAVQTMAASIQEVSRNARQSAAVAQTTLASSRKGGVAVHNNIDAMARIRDQVQETAQRIKRLGERSQEIGKSTQLIKDIANRTSMLALNASIQAGMAGEAGRGFVVVAEEIENLAERATNVTKQITALVQAVQSETKDALSAMEDTNREVSAGSLRANEAGQALSEIETVAQELSLLIDSISYASQQQAQGSEAIARSMTEISQVTNRVAGGSQRAAVSVRQLVAQAEELSNSVVTFRLPGRIETSSPGAPSYLDTLHRTNQTYS